MVYTGRKVIWRLTVTFLRRKKSLKFDSHNNLWHFGTTQTLCNTAKLLSLCTWKCIQRKSKLVSTVETPYDIQSDNACQHPHKNMTFLWCVWFTDLTIRHQDWMHHMQKCISAWTDNTGILHLPPRAFGIFSMFFHGDSASFCSVSTTQSSKWCRFFTPETPQHTEGTFINSPSVDFHTMGLFAEYTSTRVTNKNGEYRKFPLRVICLCRMSSMKSRHSCFWLISGHQLYTEYIK